MKSKQKRLSLFYYYQYEVRELELAMWYFNRDYKTLWIYRTILLPHRKYPILFTGFKA